MPLGQKNHNIELKQCCKKFNKDFLTMAHIQRWIMESFGHPGLVCDSCASLMGKLHSSRILYKTYGEKLDPIIRACKGEPTLSFYCAVLSRFSRIRLCNPMDCSPPDSSVHGILQARILEWVAMPSSRGSS